MILFKAEFGADEDAERGTTDATQPLYFSTTLSSQWSMSTTMVTLLLCLADFIDLLNESRKIGLSETHVWRGDAMMLDVGRGVFMVGHSRSQSRVIGMWKVIVPI